MSSKRVVRLVLAGAVLVLIYILGRVGEVGRYKSAPIEPAIQLLRELAASDTLRLAEVLETSASCIPAGEFLMGSDNGRDDERPQRAVYLDSFDIDRYEVTNAQFARYLQATGRPAPRYWSEVVYPFGQADFPVAGISWDDAEAYCRWAGKRLPTEAEWEKACRGTDARIYPWGNDWDASRANVGWSSSRSLAPTSPWDLAWDLLRAPVNEPRAAGLRPVGSYPVGGPYRAMDMIGNVSEWVADWYNWSDYSALPARNPVGVGPPWNHSVRGSCWYDPVGSRDWAQNMSRCSARSSSHETTDPRVGFRCASSRTGCRPAP